MLQIDHIYEFFYKTIFKDYAVYFLPNGGVFSEELENSITWDDVRVFNSERTTMKILCVDQEPIFEKLISPYLEIFKYPQKDIYKSVENLLELEESDATPYMKFNKPTISEISSWKLNEKLLFKDTIAMCVSEKSKVVTQLAYDNNLKLVYYFFHGFAALDWFRGFYALNHSLSTVKSYKYDFISFNRLLTSDRSYRCYFISLLTEKKLINKGQISFGLVDDESWHEEVNSTETKLSSNAINHIKQHLPTLQLPLTIDGDNILGCASADIPRCSSDSFWHIVSETVFYHNKLHLTEKIFKPIVMKQPFMLLASPGNLAYLKSYGFKTFDCVISEKYDIMVNPTARVDAVVDQLNWYCNLTESEKVDIMCKIEPIVEYNFHWFYNGFKERIATELLDNTKGLFNDMGINDSSIDYAAIYKTLTT